MYKNILNNIYNNPTLMKIFAITVIALIILFLIIFVIATIEKKKRLHPKDKKEEELKDISFDEIKESDMIKEDVTFEMPSLTKNLEDFKKSIEEEMDKQNDTRIIETKVKVQKKEEGPKTYKIEGPKEVEDTSVFEIKEEDKNA